MSLAFPLGEIMDGRAHPRCKPKPCLTCKQVYTPTSNGQSYCSDACTFHANYRVEDSGCWEWQKMRDKNGYGTINLKKRSAIKAHGMERAHRFSYRLHHGEIPADLIVRHKCDNPSCVNPAHLELGTHAQHTWDAVLKNRPVHGEQVHTVKLTEADVIAIRAETGTLQEIADRYGVDKTNISCIRRGKTWRHLLREQAAA